MTYGVTDVTPVAGPRWTQRRLVAMLTDCYGTNSRGTVNVDAVAEYVGVSPQTVRRWLRRPPPNRRLAVAPRARITQLQQAPASSEARNAQAYEYALTAIAKLQTDTGVLASWHKQGWLDEHTVAVVEIHGKPWHQVVVTKANHRALAELRRRAAILIAVAQPTRFHAQVLAYRVMVRQQHWRVHPAESELAIGRTQVWMADAPPIDLESEAASMTAGT